MKKFKIYRDGKDLYITDKKLNDTEYEECVGEDTVIEDVTWKARDMVLDDDDMYVWVDTDLIEKVDAPDIGEFFVQDGNVVEMEKNRGLKC